MCMYGGGHLNMNLDVDVSLTRSMNSKVTGTMNVKVHMTTALVAKAVRPPVPAAILYTFECLHNVMLILQTLCMCT